MRTRFLSRSPGCFVRAGGILLIVHRSHRPCRTADIVLKIASGRFSQRGSTSATASEWIQPRCAPLAQSFPRGRTVPSRNYCGRPRTQQSEIAPRVTAIGRCNPLIRSWHRRPRPLRDHRSTWSKRRRSRSRSHAGVALGSSKLGGICQPKSQTLERAHTATRRLRRAVASARTAMGESSRIFLGLLLTKHRHIHTRLARVGSACACVFQNAAIACSVWPCYGMWGGTKKNLRDQKVFSCLGRCWGGAALRYQQVVLVEEASSTSSSPRRKVPLSIAQSGASVLLALPVTALSLGDALPSPPE